MGKRAKDKRSAANYLVKKYGFKRMRLDDGIVKFARDVYKYGPYKRVTWERRLEMYDALYKIDSEMHIDYLLRRLSSTTRDVVTDDPRYINEVNKLKDAGYIVIRVSPGDNKRTRLSGMKHAAPQTVKLQEYYGYNFDAYPVDFSYTNESLPQMRRNIDRIVDRLRASELNSPQGELKEEDIIGEKEVRSPD